MVMENLNIELTTRCPLRCPQCYCYLDEAKDIPFEKVKYWLDEAKKNNVKAIYLSGGETLCYPYLFDVIREARTFCQDVEMATSGVGFDQELLDRLNSAGINKISVSLNGSTREINSYTRDGYDYAINALKLLKKNGFQGTIINWVMHSNNVDDFKEIIRIADEYQVSRIIIFSFKPDSSHTLRTAPSFEQMKKLVKAIRDCPEKVNISIESCYSPLLALFYDTQVFGNLNVGKNKGCLAGINRMSVNVEGKLSPCRHLDYYEDFATIEDYWNNSKILEEIRYLHKNTSGKCKVCKYTAYCRPCLAYSSKIDGVLRGENAYCPCE